MSNHQDLLRFSVFPHWTVRSKSEKRLPVKVIKIFVSMADVVDPLTLTLLFISGWFWRDAVEFLWISNEKFYIILCSDDQIAENKRLHWWPAILQQLVMDVTLYIPARHIRRISLNGVLLFVSRLSSFFFMITTVFVFWWHANTFSSHLSSDSKMKV